MWAYGFLQIKTYLPVGKAIKLKAALVLASLGFVLLNNKRQSQCSSGETYDLSSHQLSGKYNSQDS